jgi:hypothetical protein
VLAVSAAVAGAALTAVMLITLVCATSAACTVGVLPSCLRTCAWTAALVTSCSMVCTSVGVTCCGAVESAPGPVGLCTSTWAVEAYCRGWVSEMARLAATPRSASPVTHHFRRRTSRMYERSVGPAPGSGVMLGPPWGE